MAGGHRARAADRKPLPVLAGTFHGCPECHAKLARPGLGANLKSSLMRLGPRLRIQVCLRQWQARDTASLAAGARRSLKARAGGLGPGGEQT